MTKKEKIERAKKLDLSIHEGMKKFKIELTPGSYMALDGGDVCGCAIGSAILAKAKSRPELRKLYNKFENMDTDDHPNFALEIINEGVTKEDLRHLEAGFECWEGEELTYDGMFNNGSAVLNKQDPFYKLGRKLRKEQIAAAHEKEIKDLQKQLEEDLKLKLEELKFEKSEELIELGLK